VLGRWLGSPTHRDANLPPKLGAATLDRIALRAPTQHAAIEIGDIGETRLLQNHRRLRRAAAGAANRDDRPVTLQFTSARGKLVLRDQHRPLDYDRAAR
jgi:hypothetical protein